MLRRCRRSNHREQRRIDAIGPGREDAELAAFLPTVEEKFARVLEVIALNHLAENALRRNRRAIRGQHQGDFALWHDCHGHFDDAILPAPETKMQSRREGIGLIPGLAAQRDKAAGWQPASAEPFYDDSHLAFLNEHGAEHERP